MRKYDFYFKLYPSEADGMVDLCRILPFVNAAVRLVYNGPLPEQTQRAIDEWLRRFIRFANTSDGEMRCYHSPVSFAVRTPFGFLFGSTQKSLDQPATFKLGIPNNHDELENCWNLTDTLTKEGWIKRAEPFGLFNSVAHRTLHSGQ